MTPLDRFFSQTSMLPPAPRVVSDLLARLEDPNVDIKSVGNMLSRDPVLVAKILRMANSSYYGVPGTIGSVDRALQLLGLLQVQVIVITCGVAGAFSNVKGLSLAHFWRTSLLAALVARALAVGTALNPNLAFTAALMHGIGQLLIHSSFPEAGEELDQAVDQADIQGRRMAEHEVLGVDHCEIGAELARRWSLPASIINAIRYYAEPESKDAEPLARLTYVATMLAHTIESEGNSDAAIAAVPPAAMRALAIDADALRNHVDGFKAMVGEVADML